MARWSRIDPAADRELVRVLRSGEAEALGVLYDRFAERLYDFCALILPTRTAADVVHDTLIDAVERAARMRDRGMLGPWLYGTARRRSLRFAGGAAGAGHASVREALSPLSRVQQDALFLTERHGLTQSEMATVLGVSRRRVVAQLTRARQRVDDTDCLHTDALVLPMAVRHRVLHTCTDPELAGYRATIAARGGVLSAHGLPRQPDSPVGVAGRRIATIGGLATGLAMLLLLGTEVPVPGLQAPPRPIVESSPDAERKESVDAMAGGRSAVAPPHHSSTPRPTPTPSPSATTTAPPVTPGELEVSPRVIRFRQGSDTAKVRLSAVDGPVTWQAVEDSRRIWLATTEGTIAEGESMTVTVHLRERGLKLAGSTQIRITAEEVERGQIKVTWDASILRAPAESTEPGERILRSIVEIVGLS